MGMANVLRSYLSGDIGGLKMEMLSDDDGQVIQPQGRFKVNIKCNQCGTQYVLRASYDKQGNMESFKMCLCGNSDVEIARI